MINPIKSGGDIYGKKKLAWETLSGGVLMLEDNGVFKDKSWQRLSTLERNDPQLVRPRDGNKNSISDKLTSGPTTNGPTVGDYGAVKTMNSSGNNNNDTMGLVDVDVHWSSNNIEYLPEEQRQAREVAEKELARAEGLNEAWLAKNSITLPSHVVEADTLRTQRRRGRPLGGSSTVAKGKLHVKSKEGGLSSKSTSPSLAGVASKVGRKRKGGEGALSSE